MHDPIVRHYQEGGGDRVGEERSVGEQRAFAQPHAAHREARQRADQHGQNHRQQTDVKAVAELVPEILEIPGLLRHDRAEALERWLGGPDIAVELDFTFFGVERDQQHVVDGRQ